MKREFSQLIEFWDINEELNERLGLSSYNIALLEQTHKVKFPDSFKDYLSTVCPKAFPDLKYDGIFDNAANLWWDMKKLGNSQFWFKETFRESVFLFSDWGLECAFFGICCKEGEDYGKITLNDPPSFYAANIYEFIDKQLIDAQQDNSLSKAIRQINKKLKN